MGGAEMEEAIGNGRGSNCADSHQSANPKDAISTADGILPIWVLTSRQILPEPLRFSRVLALRARGLRAREARGEGAYDLPLKHSVISIVQAAKEWQRWLRLPTTLSLSGDTCMTACMLHKSEAQICHL